MFSLFNFIFRNIPTMFLEITKSCTRCLLQAVFFFFGRNFARFRPEKYDFNLYKGFSMEKMGQIRQNLFF
jgi:hypothetical protein